MEVNISQIGLKKEDVVDRVKWRNDLRTVEKHEVIPATFVNADKTELKKNWISLSSIVLLWF